MKRPPDQESALKKFRKRPEPNGGVSGQALTALSDRRNRYWINRGGAKTYYADEVAWKAAIVEMTTNGQGRLGGTEHGAFIHEAA